MPIDTCDNCTHWKRGFRTGAAVSVEGKTFRQEEWQEANAQQVSGLHPWGTCYGVPPAALPTDDYGPFPGTHESDRCPNFVPKT